VCIMAACVCAPLFVGRGQSAGGGGCGGGLHLRSWRICITAACVCPYVQALDDLLEVVGVDGGLAVPKPSWHYAEDPDEQGAAGHEQVGW